MGQSDGKVTADAGVKVAPVSGVVVSCGVTVGGRKVGVSEGVAVGLLTGVNVGVGRAGIGGVEVGVSRVGVGGVDVDVGIVGVLTGGRVGVGVSVGVGVWIIVTASRVMNCWSQ